MAYARVLVQRKSSNTKPFLRKEYFKKCSAHPTHNQLTTFCEAGNILHSTHYKYILICSPNITVCFKLWFQNVLQEIQFTSEVWQNCSILGTINLMLFPSILLIQHWDHMDELVCKIHHLASVTAI